ncbi:unnamed protein product, partial [Dovyalis caffra]
SRLLVGWMVLASLLVGSLLAVGWLTFTIGASRLHCFGASGLLVPTNKTQKAYWPAAWPIGLLACGRPAANGIGAQASRPAGGQRAQASRPTGLRAQANRPIVGRLTSGHYPLMLGSSDAEVASSTHPKLGPTIDTSCCWLFIKHISERER